MAELIILAVSIPILTLWILSLRKPEEIEE